MPPSTIRSGAFSPPLSSATSYTTGMHSKLNIVSRLAIEGKAKQGTDGATVKLYLKLNVPVDAVTPGQTIPLFTEDDVKIRDSQIHPLDSNSVPYNFSSTSYPLLHNAARALNLPARSTKSYLSMFDSSGYTSSGKSTPVNGSVVPQLEVRYTGYILVSGYNVCFVVPKEFPPRYKLPGAADSDGESLSRSVTRIKSRRGSIGERNSLHFMAGLEVWVPYLSKPLRAPFLISIPIPRCLSNNIKFRIFQPTPVSSSFASLSSDEDYSGWELATEPHVTRTLSKHGRSSSYMNFADDESSESSMGAADNCIIQGTFPSSDYIRIRWATPLKDQDVPSDGRRRVGVRDVQGNMTCTVLERTEDGVKMRLDFQGVCSGVWFPGVATLLGLDVSLDTHGCRCSWPGDSHSQWQLDGESAFTGFSVGVPSAATLTRESSLETPQLRITRPGETLQRLGSGLGSPTPSRTSSTSSSSLLRAPLPQPYAPEYSFEDSATPTTPGVQSSVNSMTQTSSSVFGLSAEADRILRPPTSPITVHINMNELQPYPKNTFVFNITGTVNVAPPMYDSLSDTQLGPIPLPMFSVHAAESELVSTSVRNQCEDVNVEVLSGLDATSNSGSNKKTLLSGGSQTKCGTDGGTVTVKSRSPKLSVDPNGLSRTVRTPQTPISAAQASEPTTPANISQQTVIFRDGPLIIPWVNAVVIPSDSDDQHEWSYGVRLSLPAPVDDSSEWLEFGLAMPPSHGASGNSVSTQCPPKVSIACASANGVPVRFETFGQLKPELEVLAPSAVESESKRKWLTWVRVHCGHVGQSTLAIDYVVKGSLEHSPDPKGKRRQYDKDVVQVDVFLPVFALPVASLSAAIKSTTRHDDVSSDLLAIAPAEKSFHAFNLGPFESRNLVLTQPWRPAKSPQTDIRRSAWKAIRSLSSVIPFLAMLFLLAQVGFLRQETRQLRELLGNHTTTDAGSIPSLSISGSRPADSAETSSERWWKGSHGYTFSASLPPSSTLTPSPIPTSQPAPSEVEWEDYWQNDSGPEEHSSGAAAVPIIYVPLSWIFQQRVQYEQVKSQIVWGWERVWHVLEVILNFPLGSTD